MTESGKISKSRVYVEVTIPNETGEPVSYFAEGEVTGQLDLRELDRILEMSKSEFTKALGLRTY